MGATHDPAKPGDYGWSPAYQEVLALRLRYDWLYARRGPTLEEIQGAVARGWCYDSTSHKIMDLELAEAIAVEVWKLF